MLTNLVESHRPRVIAEFIGLAQPKAVLTGLRLNPRPCALLFSGPPGVGKTTMALAFARELGGGLIHVPAHSLNKDTVENLWESMQYFPGNGSPWWVVLADESDLMTRAAQEALLSKLDAAATLRPAFGAGCEEGASLPAIWVFTSNAVENFEPRFVSRCFPLKFEPPQVDEIAGLLKRTWNGLPWQPDFKQIAYRSHGNVRDALQALELAALSGPPPGAPEPVQMALKPKTTADKLRDLETLFYTQRRITKMEFDQRCAAIMNEAA